MALSRRNLLKVTAVSTLPMPAIAQDTRARTLRLVPSTDLVSLDPVFSTALVAVQHGYHVFDTLYGVDARLEPRPQMAEGHTVEDDGRVWTIRLREGLRFHDGEPVRARDCAASLLRWSKRDPFGRALGAVVDRYEAVSDRDLRIHLRRPFPRLLDALGKPHSAPVFIMPERVAQTPPTQPITEIVGSGPFRFLPSELNSGSRVAYARFGDYVPRVEAPEWTSGGKIVHFDRVEWHVINDQSTAVSALLQGEVDWLENVSADLMPLLSGNNAVRTAVSDPLGTELVLRFNHVAAPFNNAALRRFVLGIIHQPDYLAALTASNPATSRECRAFFPCTVPGVAEVGRQQFSGLLGQPDALRDALKATGYKGEKVVILNPADSAALAPLGPITADALTRAGLNVDLQDMDWGTLLQRRTSKDPVERGGWSIYHSTWPSIAISNPVLNTTIRGEGAEGWPGWYQNAEMERLTSSWLDANDTAARDQLIEQVHTLALQEVPSLPLGIYLPSTAYRTNLSGVLDGSVRYPWNVRRA